jgi:hypothetical protein
MALAFLYEAFWHFKVDPVICLLREVMLSRNLDFSVAENISEEFTSATSVFSYKSKLLLDFLRVLIKEQSGVEGSIGLLPHFADEEMSIECVLSLFSGVSCKHSKHGVDPHKLVIVRTVQELRLSIFLLSLRKSSGCLLGSS